MPGFTGLSLNSWTFSSFFVFDGQLFYNIAMQLESLSDFYSQNRYLVKAVLGFLAAFLLAFAFFPKLSSIASRIGLLDIPTRRKSHSGAKPLVGGIGMAMALGVACLVFVPLVNLRGFYAGFVLLVIVGFLDDFKELKYGGKFIAQILAVLFMVYFSHVSLNTFGNLVGMGQVDFGILALPMTLFCTVGVINAFNMVDGLDALAGSVSFTAFIVFAFLAYLNSQAEVAMLAVAFSGAVLAFLWYNRPPAKLFMGDAGSLSIGFALAFFSVAITQKPGGIVSPVASLMILAVPVCDTIRLIIARLLRRKSPFAADNKHLHHLLIRIGFSRKRAVLIILMVSVLLAVLSVAGTLLRWPDYGLFAVFVVYAVVYTALTVSIKKIVAAKIRLRNAGRRQYDSSRFRSALLVIATAARIIRRDSRVSLKASVKGKFMGRIFSGLMMDLSNKGFSAIIGLEFAVGDLVEFEICLTGMPAKLEVTSEVVWTEKKGPDWKCGFRIIDISRPEAEFLRLYLDNPDLRAA